MGPAASFIETTASLGDKHDRTVLKQSTKQPTSCDESSRIEQQLLDWQTSGEQDRLESLVHTVLPLAEQMAEASLHRLGVHDPSAVDETISLVLDHLRRLPGPSTGERPVARFTLRRDDRCNSSLTDSGKAYIAWLVRERAADVARAHRRRRKRTTVFSLLDEQAAGHLQGCVASGDPACDEMPSQADLCMRLHDAIPRLPARERLLIELLLEGRNQATIAHMLDVCEGTVSRLRNRAIATLRDLVAE